MSSSSPLNDPMGMMFARTVVIAMLLVALSDGELGFDERAAIVEFLGIGLDGQLSAEHTLALIQTMIDLVDATPESGWPALFEQARQRLPEELKTLLLDLCVRTACSDGSLGALERARIEQVAVWLQPSETAALAWKARVNAAIDKARAEGLPISRF